MQWDFEIQCKQNFLFRSTELQNWTANIDDNCYIQNQKLVGRFGRLIQLCNSCLWWHYTMEGGTGCTVVGRLVKGTVTVSWYKAYNTKAKQIIFLPVTWKHVLLLLLPDNTIHYWYILMVQHTYCNYILISSNNSQRELWPITSKNSMAVVHSLIPRPSRLHTNIHKRLIIIRKLWRSERFGDVMVKWDGHGLNIYGRSLNFLDTHRSLPTLSLSG